MFLVQSNLTNLRSHFHITYSTLKVLSFNFDNSNYITVVRLSLLCQRRYRSTSAIQSNTRNSSVPSCQRNLDLRNSETRISRREIFETFVRNGKNLKAPRT